MNMITTVVMVSKVSQVDSLFKKKDKPFFARVAENT